MRMGRPRSTRKDLPPGLHWDGRRGYYYRSTKAGSRRYVGIGRVEREAAIARWVELTRDLMPKNNPLPGTLAELMGQYRERGLPLVPGESTRKEYTRQLVILEKRWGAKTYARTADAAQNSEHLRPGFFNSYLDAFRRGERGAIQARQDVRLVSSIFSWAIGRDYTSFNPCIGVDYPQSKPRKGDIDDETLAKIVAVAPKALRLMIQFGEITGVRKTDIRLLTIQQVKARIDVEQSKTQMPQTWEISPGVRAILDEAATLPGRVRSTFIFPSRKGTPYTENGMQTMWRRACAKAGVTGKIFRDLRTEAINDAQDAGMDAQAFAGHADPRTTRRHYLKRPVKVTPLR